MNSKLVNNPLQNLRSFMAQLFLIKRENVSKTRLSGAQDFGNWKKVCEGILAKPYPPQGSDFSDEEIKAGNRGAFSKLSNWEIVCEEMVDTEYSPIWYQRCYDELRRRGKSEQEIFEMRRFAWQTVGWFNFPMMLWDWVSLDESDILRAIKLLYDYKQISQEEQVEFENFVKLHSS
jgi:hypothetical protein